MPVQTGVRSGLHVVRFYERDTELCDAIVEFVEEGLARREPILLVTTAPHWQAVVRRIGWRLEFHTAINGGDLAVLDAHAIVDAMTMDGRVEAGRFTTAALPSVGQGRAPMRMFGEVASLLAARGDIDAALALEQAGSAAAANGALVLCAYALAHLAADRVDVQRVVCCHDHAIGTPAG